MWRDAEEREKRRGVAEEDGSGAGAATMRSDPGWSSNRVTQKARRLAIASTVSGCRRYAYIRFKTRLVKTVALCS